MSKYCPKVRQNVLSKILSLNRKYTHIEFLTDSIIFLRSFSVALLAKKKKKSTTWDRHINPDHFTKLTKGKLYFVSSVQILVGFALIVHT